MEKKVQAVGRLFSLLEKFSQETEEFQKIYHKDISQIEYPNLLTKNTSERNMTAMLKGLAMAPKILKEQKFDIKKCFGSGDHLAVEVVWTGSMLNDFGPLKQGQKLKAFICFIFEFKDHKILRQRNYDCYEPFA